MYGCAASTTCNKKRTLTYKTHNHSSITFDCCFTNNCNIPKEFKAEKNYLVLQHTLLRPTFNPDKFVLNNSSNSNFNDFTLHFMLCLFFNLIFK